MLARSRGLHLEARFRGYSGLASSVYLGGERMAKFSFHCQNYKSGQIGAIDKHNRRLNKNYSNIDIDTARSSQNHIYIAPRQSLYKDCKIIINDRVIANGGRITKASNWLCECVFSYPEEFPIERLDEYNKLIIDYLGARIGKNNIVMAVCHVDEAGLPHMHLDFVPVTEDNRLSSKNVVTREFITSIHKLMPMILQKHGFNVQSYEETAEVKIGGLSAKEYKKKMDKENDELNQKLDVLTEEYNNLVEQYNSLQNANNDLKRRYKHNLKEYESRRNISR